MQHENFKENYVDVLILELFLKFPVYHNDFLVEIDNNLIVNLKRISKEKINWEYVIEHFPLFSEDICEYDFSIFFESCKQYLQEHQWIVSFGNILWIHSKYSYLYNRKTHLLIKFDWQNDGEVLTEHPSDLQNVLKGFDNRMTDEDLYFNYLMEN